MVERLLRRAISETASKSPSEAIGKPASMMSTPIVSSISATSSFSSKVMVAPGHCSPSRSVVSKISTRSFEEAGVEAPWLWVESVMVVILKELAPLSSDAGASNRKGRSRHSPERPGMHARPALRGG